MTRWPPLNAPTRGSGSRSGPAARWRSAPVVRLMRPRQWIKNLLVFASPAAAGVLDDPEYATRALVVVRGLLPGGERGLLPQRRRRRGGRPARTRSSATDRWPRVRCRPPWRCRSGIGLLVAGLLVAGLTGSWAPVGVVALYVALQPAYTYWLKHVAVIDMIVVSAGFVLRARGRRGGHRDPRVRLVPDRRLVRLLVPRGQQALHRAAARRRRRRGTAPPSTPTRRRSCSSCGASSVSITLLAYCLWAFEKASVADPWVPWFELSIVPFTALLFRYALAHETSELAGPEDIVLGDRQLQGIGVAWIACLADRRVRGRRAAAAGLTHRCRIVRRARIRTPGRRRACRPPPTPTCEPPSWPGSTGSLGAMPELLRAGVALGSVVLGVWARVTGTEGRAPGGGARAEPTAPRAPPPAPPALAGAVR